jgi:hypothetical protein
MRTDLPSLFRARVEVAAGFVATLTLLAVANSNAQTYALPADGDFGGMGPFTVFVDSFTNPVYPSANGAKLTVSVYHPNATINPALPTIFLAHGYTSPIGSTNVYLNILNHLASRGYNVVFSPYEGGSSPNIVLRFDELTTGFAAAVTNYGLNTAQVGFIGHSYGGGFLPAIILHLMMGKADFYRAGHTWGGTGAFFFGMGSGYAYSGGGQTDVSATRTVFFPTNLNVIEQAYHDDTSIADPRVAIDIFYNVTTANSQKAFFTVYGDRHGTNPVVADHFLPNAYTNANVPLQAWAILRRLDALAAWTFTGDTAARQIALGDGIPAQTDQGVWSDGVPVTPVGVTDLPLPNVFPSSYAVVDWDSAANPRRKYGLFSGPPVITGVATVGGRAWVTVTNLLANHNYVEQQTPSLSSANWSNAATFIFTQTELQTNFSATLTNTLGTSPSQFWRILAP